MNSKLKKDRGLVTRMYFTWFLLGVLYAFFAFVLNAYGVQIGFIVTIVLLMVLSGQRSHLSFQMLCLTAQPLTDNYVI